MAIHEEKFNVSLSGDDCNDLFNIVKQLKTFTGSAEIAKTQGLEEKPEITIVILCLY